MKKLYVLLSFSFALQNKAQVFTGTGGAISNGAVTKFQATVSGLPVALDSLYGIEKVCIDLVHPAVDELHITLRSPAGIEVELTGMKSCKGANFSITCFNNAEPISVTIAGAPHNGTFRPVGNLGRFNAQQTGNGTWELAVDDFVGGVNSGTLNGFTLEFGNAPAQPVFLHSSNLPLIHINTPGRVPLADTDILVSLKITDNGTARNYFTDPGNNYDGKAACHIRGASSRMFEKNNLKLELKDASGSAENPVSLLGMPIESDWILTACYTDKTLMRNPLSQYLFQSMGHYSPRWRYVELILNGEYSGVYVLMEQIKRGNDRVNIAKLDPGGDQFPAITGGYILQIDRTDAPGWYSLNPGVSANSAKFFYQYNYPKADVISAAQMTYIKSVLDSFETVMAAPDFSHPATGYKKFIDDNTFVDYMILNELSKNADAYKLSSYLYKDNILDGGKLHAGPVWDFDLAWHNCNFGNTFSADVWQHIHNNSTNPIPTWWRRLMEDPAFQNKLYCRYHTLRQGLLSHDALFEYIDETVDLLEEARERNYRQFPIIGAYIWANPQNQVAMSYASEITHLKTWIVNRSAWLDVNVPGFCADVSTGEQIPALPFAVFPNPFANALHIRFTEPTLSGPVSVALYNAAGNLVMEDAFNGLAERHITLHTADLAPGIYLLRTNQNGLSSCRKMIKE